MGQDRSHDAPRLSGARYRLRYGKLAIFLLIGSLLSMLTISAMGHGSGEYYLGLTRRGREEYYVDGSGTEPPGVWLGSGARRLGLSDIVKHEELRNLLKGFSPDGTKKLIQNAGDKNHQVGWDLSFSAVKSVSVLWSQAGREIRKQIEEAHVEAVKAAISYLEETGAYTRRGKGGRVWEETELIVAAFEHGTSRAHDPQLHTHCLVLNVCMRADGTSGTILSKPIYARKMAAGALYRAALSAELESRLGLRTERSEAFFEIPGVSRTLIEEFSKRREQIEEALSLRGETSAKAADIAALATREVKRPVPREELFKAWREVGQAHGFGPKDVAALLMKQPPRPDPTERMEATVRRALERLTQHQSHFCEREFLRNVAEESQAQGLSAPVIRDAVARELQASPEIVELGRFRGEIHYSTREVLELEKKMLSLLDNSRNASCPSVSEAQLSKAIAAAEREASAVLKKKGPALPAPLMNEEQKAALRHVTGSEGSVQEVSGMAGTGKTLMCAAARRAFEAAGLTVIGTAISGKAAAGLEAATGIKSTTVAKLIGIPEKGFAGDLDKTIADDLKHHARQMLRAGRGKSTWKPPERIKLDSKSVLLVDEAGMVDTRTMLRLLEETKKANARLILIGDGAQLQPIGMGNPFNAIAERLGEKRLTEIVRQREAWSRQAVYDFACGETQAALKAYAERDLLTVEKNQKAAMKELISQWKSQGVENPKDNLILAGMNVEVASLNRMAQGERKIEGKLGAKSIQVGEDEISQRDRVVFTRNSKAYQVKNGHLGTVLGIDSVHQCLIVCLDHGPSVTIPVGDYDAIKLGYAVTCHRAQGLTVENSYVLLGGPMQDREISYVQASRARGLTRFFTTELEAGEELKEICEQMARSRQKLLAHDVLKHSNMVPEL